MERVKEEDIKLKLVKDICNISSRAADCSHRRHRGKRPFIDWYLVLQVEENANLDGIKKQYHKLALRIHPDKNKHPQAEVAFNLLHQAYTCLIQDSTRQEFEYDRQKNLCVECNRKSNPNLLDNPTTRFSTRSSKVARNINSLRVKLFEEVIVIENCLFNKSSKKELPVFNPSDYLSKGYPHYRPGICRRAKTLSRFQTENIDNCRRQFESPIFGFE